MNIYNDDCLNILPQLDTDSADMVLCDLPFGVTKCKWDIVIPFDDLWKEYDRIVKPNGAVVLFGREPFTSMMIMSNLKNYRQKLTWLKTRPTNVFNAKKQFMNWTEDIVVFYRKLPTFNPQMRTDGQFTGAKLQHPQDRSKGVFNLTGERAGYVHQPNGGLFYPKTVLEFSNVNEHKHLHPTQKPVPLLEYLIKTYTNEGDTVLDNCMGSGSTGVACKNLNRNFIGIELDEAYFKIAEERLNQ